MRIVSGQYGGRRLNVPKGQDIRPTSDKVRGAIFNTLLGFIDLADANVLDAFCGTGALGLEALSRGALRCVFVDKAKVSLDLARGNAEMLGAEGCCKFLVGDASKVHLSHGDGFDLLFFDPPYHKDLIIPALRHCEVQGVIADNAICVLESERGADIHVPDGFELLRDKEYGDTVIRYVRYSRSVV